MEYTSQELSQIFYNGNAVCRICGASLLYSSYGNFWALGNWEVHHIIPLARGGPHVMSNLAPACMSCNRSKQDH